LSKPPGRSRRITRPFSFADGCPDGKPGAFYLFDQAGGLIWKYKTSNMSWPAQISRNTNAIAAGSDDSYVYYFA